MGIPCTSGEFSNLPYFMCTTAHFSSPNDMTMSLLNSSISAQHLFILAVFLEYTLRFPIYSRLITFLFIIVYPTSSLFRIFLIGASARQKINGENISPWNIPRRKVMSVDSMQPFLWRRKILVLHFFIASRWFLPSLVLHLIPFCSNSSISFVVTWL